MGSVHPKPYRALTQTVTRPKAQMDKHEVGKEQPGSNIFYLCAQG